MDGYQDKQLNLIEEIEDSFKSGNSPSTIVEPVSDYTKDNRICLAIVSFIPKALEDEIITRIINPLKNADPRQYFYVPSSFHITLQNVRTIEDPPLFDDNDVEKVKFALNNYLPKFGPIKFEMRRIFELPTSLSICAFTNNNFGDLAIGLREELEKAGVSDNKKYAESNVVLANSTFCRFQTEPNEEFKKVVNELKTLR